MNTGDEFGVVGVLRKASIAHRREKVYASHKC
jgi:hypothetical protein